MNSKNTWRINALEALLWAALFTCIAICACNLKELKHIPDADQYLLMAHGNSKDAILPFAKRILYPWIIQSVSSVWGVENSFIALGTFSYFLFIALLIFILRNKIGMPILGCLGFIFIPETIDAYHYIYLPYVFCLTLTALYVFFLIEKQYFRSALVLFFLFLTRDESIILALSFILTAIFFSRINPDKRKEYCFYIFSVIIAAIASFFIVHCQIKSNVNLHRMPQFLYLLFKVPYYALRHFGGVVLWVDTWQNLASYAHPPLMMFAAPMWLSKISAIKNYGVYEFNLYGPANIVITFLSIFGTGPTILAHLLFKAKNQFINGTLAIYTLLVYGTILFFIAPLIGATIKMYFYAAWPVFFITIPYFYVSLDKVSKKMFFCVLAYYASAAWLPFLVGRHSGNYWGLWLLSFGVLVLLHLRTWHVLNACQNLNEKSTPPKSKGILLNPKE